MNYQGKVNAPEFPAGLEWLNTDRPLFIKELRGKIVLLDFWTYCCINCMHIIPDIKRLEEKYEAELVVIGVHSAKFTNERDTDNIRQAVLRYEIEHPVVNDSAMEIWQQYAVRAWPTLMLIDPDGKVVGGKSGEGIFEAFDRAIEQLILEFEAQGKLNRRLPAWQLEPEQRERAQSPELMLAFPGKVLADEASNQLFIADSNHNRLVVAAIDDYTVKEVVGGGGAGLKDGSFDDAEFHHPQGLAVDGKTLYVADTENHAIRKIDFETRAVTTVAGNGRQASRIDLIGGIGSGVSLNSPWDLVLHEGMLYVAMAGSHQLWMMNPKTGGAIPFAGRGAENLMDGPLMEAALAQPSGITTDGRKLYFADSEVSAVRAADLDMGGQVETIIGAGLFAYGDKDGKAAKARLQHPLGIAYHQGFLYVADTYNHKIKIVSLKSRSAATFSGTGKKGLADGAKALFNEPGGVSIAFGKLYIADTNNHAIRVADLKNKKVSTVSFKNPEKLRPAQTFLRMRQESPAGESIDLPVQEIEPGAATIHIDLQLPDGYKLDPQAPSHISVSVLPRHQISLKDDSDGDRQPTVRPPQFPQNLPIIVKTEGEAEGEAVVSVLFVLYYCESAEANLCYFKEARVNLPVKVKADAGNKRLRLVYQAVLSSAKQ